MRKCVRCGTEMEEESSFTGSFGNVIRRKGLSGKAAYPKAALCPVCGGVSIYVDEEHLEKLIK